MIACIIECVYEFGVIYCQLVIFVCNRLLMSFQDFKNNENIAKKIKKRNIPSVSKQTRSKTLQMSLSLSHSLIFSQVDVIDVIVVPFESILVMISCCNS